MVGDCETVRSTETILSNQATGRICCLVLGSINLCLFHVTTVALPRNDWLGPMISGHIKSFQVTRLPLLISGPRDRKAEGETSPPGQQEASARPIPSIRRGYVLETAMGKAAKRNVQPQTYIPRAVRAKPS